MIGRDEQTVRDQREAGVLEQARQLLVDPRTWRSSYPLATLFVLAAAAARWGLDEYLRNAAPLLPFTVAVLFAAVLGGFGPGVYATVASIALLLAYFPPRSDGSWSAQPDDVIRLCAFTALGGVFSLIGWSQKRNRDRLVKALGEAGQSLTARITAEQDKRTNERIYRAIGESIDFGVWVADAEGRNLYASPSLLELVGRTQDELAGFRWIEALHPDDAQATLEAWQDCVKSGCSWQRQYRFLGTDGKYRHVLARGEPIRNEQGELTAWAGINLDIQALKQIEDALRRSEREFRSLANASPHIVWAARPDGYIDYFNERWYDFTGFARDELGAEVRERVLHPDDRQRAKDTYDASIRDVKPYDVEYRFFDRRSGGYRWFLGRAVPLVDEQGEVVRWFGTSTDIDELKRNQIELERLSAIVQGSRDFIALFDEEGRAQFLNGAALQLVGAGGFDEVRSRGLADFFVEEQRAFVGNQVLPAVRGEGRWSGELELRHFGSAAATPVVLDVFRIHGPHSGRPVTFAAVGRDIAERRRAESERERLLASERRARVDAERAGRLKDEFLATLSHELRTPLNAIVGWVHLLRTDLGNADTVREGVAVIERNARAQAQLVSDLLDMSRITSGKLRLDVQRVDLPSVIEGALASIQPAALAKGVRLQSILEPSVEPVYGDPARLQQIVWNLLSNAIKFTPKGGRVQIVLARVNSHVEITVSDTGKGIDAEFLPHVFERFRQADASTSREHTGLGIGLALVKHLAELHGGSVRAASDGEGKGATFTVELPSAILRVPQDEDSRIHPRSQARSASPLPEISLEGVRVLIVDDEADAAAMLRQLLERSRAEVAVVASVDQALELLEHDQYDVLVSDIGMPRRDGFELIAEVRKRGLRLPAAALTAFARAEDRTRALLAGFQAHVPKPVEPAELVATIASLARRTRL